MRPLQNQDAQNTLPIVDKLQKNIDRVDALYGTKVDNISQAIKDGISGKFNEINDNGPKAQQFVDLLQDIFDEREKAIKSREEILEKKIFTHLLQKTPQKISVKKELEEKRSVTTPTAAEIRSIMLESAKTQDVIDMNQQRLKSLVSIGCDISEEEKEKLSNLRTGNKTYQQALKHTAQSLGSSIISSGNQALNQIGRGIFSKGEAGKSGFVDEYRTILDQRIKNLKSSIDPKNSKYAKILEKMVSSLKSSQDPLEIASCDSLCSLIQTEIDAENKEYKAAIDKLDKDVSDATKEMMGKVQSDIDKSDEQWKYRAMSMFLIFTPLGAFSIAGQVFNYLDPLVEIFGPIFEAHKSLGEGFGDAITSKQFGFLGQLMDKMEIDKAVEAIVDKTPILSNFTEIINSLTDSEIAQNAGGQMAPMLNSPLTLIAIAASFSISRAPEEIALMKSKRDNRMKYLGGTEVGIFPTESGFSISRVKDGVIDEKFNNFEKSVNQSAAKESKISKLVDEELKVLENSYVDYRAAKFVLDAMSKSASSMIIKEIAPNLASQYQQGAFDNKNGQPDISLLLRHLNTDLDSKKSLREAFVRVAAIDNNVLRNGAPIMPPQQIIGEFVELNQPDNSKKATERQKDAEDSLKKQFYFDSHRANGGTVLSGDESELTKIKKVVKSNRISFYSQNMDQIVPSSSITPVTATLLHNNFQKGRS